MVAVPQTDTRFRWRVTLTAAGALDEDLGGIGERVGPRKGPDKRTHGQKEDYVLRRLLVAWREAGRIPFPLTISAAQEVDGEPDFTLTFESGETRGLEITEAGTEDYQVWLTHNEDQTQSGDAVLLSKDGVIDRIEIGNVAEQIATAIRKKSEAHARGKYRGPQTCELAVYANTAGDGFLEKPKVVERLRRMNDLQTEFRAVHLVFESHVAVDVFGPGFRLVSMGRRYETDFVGWADDQAHLLRSRKISGLDVHNIAEEIEALAKSDRRALRSYLQVLLLHLLKWQFQPDRRASGWEYSIANSRAEIQDLLSEQPSLRPFFRETLAVTYSRARRTAVAETGLTESTFPADCPYRAEDLVDPEFLP